MDTEKIFKCLDNSKLDTYSKFLYVILCVHFSKSKEDGVSISVAELAEKMSCSRSHLIRTTKQLVEDGFISKISQFNTDKGRETNLYQIL